MRWAMTPRARSALVVVAALAAVFGLGIALRIRPKDAHVAPASLPASASAEASASAPLPEPLAPPAPVASASASAEAPAPTRCPPEPAISVRVTTPPTSSEELLRLALEHPEQLGSASIGTPIRGFLFGGVEIKNDEGILHAGGYGWGTELVIRSIERAVREVRRCFPHSPRLYVGDISRDKGGWLRPHRSHQSGLDADIGYYYRSPATWYLRVTKENLDVERTWALTRALLDGGNVDMIFMDFSVQRLLKAYLETLPEAERPPADLFESPIKKDTMIRHTWGHATHFHVRFRDEAAVTLGARMMSLLPQIRAPRRYLKIPGRR